MTFPFSFFFDLRTLMAVFSPRGSFAVPALPFFVFFVAENPGKLPADLHAGDRRPSGAVAGADGGRCYDRHQRHRHRRWSVATHAWRIVAIGARLVDHFFFAVNLLISF